MDAIEYLKQARILQKAFDAKVKVLEEKHHSLFLGVSVGGSERVQTSPKLDGNQSAIAEFEDLRMEIAVSEVELIRKKNEIIDTVRMLSDPDQVDVLIGRWVERKKVEQIAIDMNYSYRQVQRIHKKGIKKLQKIIDKMDIIS